MKRTIGSYIGSKKTIIVTALACVILLLWQLIPIDLLAESISISKNMEGIYVNGSSIPEGGETFYLSNSDRLSTGSQSYIQLYTVDFQPLLQGEEHIIHYENSDNGFIEEIFYQADIEVGDDSTLSTLNLGKLYRLDLIENGLVVTDPYITPSIDESPVYSKWNMSVVSGIEVELNSALTEQYQTVYVMEDQGIKISDIGFSTSSGSYKLDSWVCSVNPNVSYTNQDILSYDTLMDLSEINHISGKITFNAVWNYYQSNNSEEPTGSESNGTEEPTGSESNGTETPIESEPINSEVPTESELSPSESKNEESDLPLESGSDEPSLQTSEEKPQNSTTQQGGIAPKSSEKTTDEDDNDEITNVSDAYAYAVCSGNTGSEAGWYSEKVVIQAGNGMISKDSRQFFDSVTLEEGELISKLYYRPQMSNTTIELSDIYIYKNNEDAKNRTGGIRTSLSGIRVDLTAPKIGASGEERLKDIDDEADLSIYANDSGNCEIVVTETNIYEILINDKAIEKEQYKDGAVKLKIDNDIEVSQVKVTDKAGNSISCRIDFYPSWMKDGIIPEGEVTLIAGKAYSLAAGKDWMIEGDATVYHGGNTFFVVTTKKYKFKSV